MELKNEHHMPWPRLVFDKISKKIYGTQSSDGIVIDLTEYQRKVCDSWNLEYRETILPPPYTDQSEQIPLDNSNLPPIYPL
jgi:hypothetical protein